MYAWAVKQVLRYIWPHDTLCQAQKKKFYGHWIIAKKTFQAHKLRPLLFMRIHKQFSIVAQWMTVMVSRMTPSVQVTTPLQYPFIVIYKHVWLLAFAHLSRILHKRVLGYVAQRARHLRSMNAHVGHSNRQKFVCTALTCFLVNKVTTGSGLVPVESVRQWCLNDATSARRNTSVIFSTRPPT